MPYLLDRVVTRILSLRGGLKPTRQSPQNKDVVATSEIATPLFMGLAMTGRLFLRSLLLCVVANAAACTPVKPWQKEFLAKPHMRVDPTPLRTQFVHHVYESKEGTSRGYGVGGGGCGCN